MDQNERNCSVNPSSQGVKLPADDAMPEKDVDIHSAELFKNIYAHYSSKIGAVHIMPLEETVEGVKEVQDEMKQAKEAYNAMMDISHRLAEAYKALKKTE